MRPQTFNNSNISIRNPLRIAQNLTRHSMLTLATDDIAGDLYYPPTELEGLFFPRLKFFRRCGCESAPRVHFCAATPGSDKFHDCSQNSSLLFPKECDFLAEKHAFHLKGQNFDPVKRQKHPRDVALAVCVWALGPAYFGPGHKARQVFKILYMHRPKRMQKML